MIFSGPQRDIKKIKLRHRKVIEVEELDWTHNNIELQEHVRGKKA